MNRCLPMINVPPCLASEELRAHASLTLHLLPALYKANFFNSQLSLSFLYVHLASSSFISVETLHLHIFAEIRKKCFFPCLMNFMGKCSVPVNALDLKDITQSNLYLGFKWKYPCTVRWQYYIYKGSIIERNKQSGDSLSLPTF